jgi:flagellar operon protein
MALDVTRIGPASPSRPSAPSPSRPAASFHDALRQAEGITVSKHGAKRVERRDLGLDPARMTRLNSAIDRAAAKGSRSSVVMLDDLAVVVDVRSRTLVTAMNKEGGNGRVFTNIDSVVIA